MPCTVLNRHSGRRTDVKNLGWLLRHAAEVHSMTLVRRQTDVRWLENGPCTPDHPHMMRVELRDHVFEATWADWEILMRWIKRPRFDGVIVHLANDGPTRSIVIDHYKNGYRVDGLKARTADGEHVLRGDCIPDAYKPLY